MIESRHNRRLKHIRRLRRSKGDEALLDSPHLVLEAARLGLPFGELLATAEFLDDPARGGLLDELPRPPEVVAGSLLKEIVDVTSPAGIVATVTLERSAEPAESQTEGTRRLVYVDGLQDPSNLGALARVAEAAEVDLLVLRSGTVHPNHPRALRASAGSLLRLPVAVGIEPAALSASPAGEGLPWLSLVVDGGQSLYEVPLPSEWILALGSEAGLSPEVDALASQRITIPTAASVESLNATQAITVTLFELARRRGVAATD